MTEKAEISTLFKRKDRDSVVNDLKKDTESYERYRCLTDELKERLTGFLCGTRTLPLTYDPFFKKMFNPDVYPDRLSGFISSVLGRKVKVKYTLPVEESLLQGASLLIMDIVVELEDGSIANVEIQKISYLFPAQRMSCYSADLLLRQYSRVKEQKGKKFTYSDLKKVYTIIIFEQSPAELRRKEYKDTYVHHGTTIFDTRIGMNMLQDYYLIALDVFEKSYYSKDKKVINELNGWLALLSVDSTDRLNELVTDYPYLESVFVDMAGYLDKPAEVINMFSEALKILDENTVHYMIEEMQKQIDEDKEVIAEKTELLDKRNAELAEAMAEIECLKKQLQEEECPISKHFICCWYEKYKSTHDSCVLLSINYDWFKYMQPFNISKSSCQSYEIIN